jgi:hypothetical protein
MYWQNISAKYFAYIAPQIANINPKPNSMITRNMIHCQLKKDLLGKDAYRGTTQTYTLLANQFGHFALGFIPATILYIVSLNKLSNIMLLQLPWVLVVLCWAAFEIFNFRHSVVTHRKKEKERENLQQFPFKPAWGNISNDTLTDIVFFAAGAMFSGCFFAYSTWLLLSFAVVFAIAIYNFSRWYKTKMYLQEAMFPFHYRLSQWVINISQQNAATANQFLNTRQTGQHLLVFGESVPEKASLSIGIATELAFKHKRCLYITATKLFTMFTQKEMDSNPSLELESLWSWRETSVLIIDDINPTHYNGNKELSAGEFFANINHLVHGKLNRDTLKANNVIWVLGQDGTDNNKLKEWKDMLLKIGITEAAISAIHL